MKGEEVHEVLEGGRAHGCSTQERAAIQGAKAQCAQEVRAMAIAASTGYGGSQPDVMWLDLESGA